VGTHVGAVFLTKNLPYDPVKDFTPITIAVEPVSALVVHPGVPASNIQELIDYARRNPGKLAYASNGPGTVFHVAGELIKQAAGIDMLHVPLKGAGDVMNALVGGHVQVALASASQIPSYRESGKLKVIGMNIASRYSRMPDVPTIGEGLPSY